MPTNDAFQGVSNCYVFKSRLQEFAQRVGLPTPVYETIKEGPSHVPTFKSTVIVNNVRYDSLPGFFNRKAAEQSAAEVALLQLSNSGNSAGSVSQPVHETGLCKNLLQEYAQKMNYAVPVYESQKKETPGRTIFFSCTVDIGEIKYIGAAARTKKEAEIKAARTALLAIQANVSSNSNGFSAYTVVPSKKKVPESGINSQETTAALKPKEGRFKKRSRKNKHAANGGNPVKSHHTSGSEVHIDDQVGRGAGAIDGNGTRVTHIGVPPVEGANAFRLGCFSENMETALLPRNNWNVNQLANSLNADDGLNAFVKEENTIHGVEQVTSNL